MAVLNPNDPLAGKLRVAPSLLMNPGTETRLCEAQRLQPQFALRLTGGTPVPLRHRRAPSRFFLRALLALIVMGMALFPVAAQSPSPEYKLKAVYLFNFLQYVEWPKEAFASEESPWIIGVLGRDPFGRILEDTVAGETVKERKLIVQRYRNAREIKNCHVLFVSQPETKNLPALLADLRDKNILTVSDMDDFAERYGGMIRFYTSGNKIRFEINQEAARSAHLFISSKLLQLARIVHSGGGP